MTYRVAVLHQGFIPLYRVRFFEELNAAGANEYVVFHGPAPSGTGHLAAPGPFAFPNVFRQHAEIHLGTRKLIYQPVVRAVVAGGFDAVVVGDEFKLLANLAIFSAFKMMGKPAILWGHGCHRPDAHWMARMLARFFPRFADGYLAYTEGGASLLKAAGLPSERIFVIRNTVDLAEQIAMHARLQTVDADLLKRELGLRPGVPTLLYLGRLYARKRCQDLIEMARILANDGQSAAFDLALVGDGPERAALEASAAGLDNVRFLGAVYDAETLAKLMRVSMAMVNPGSVGLAVNHCFAHGVPIVTRAGMLHSPEFEYIRDGENGVVVHGELDAFAAAVRRILVDDDFRERLAAGALATRDILGLGHMVEAFDRGVSHTIERFSGKNGKPAPAAAPFVPGPPESAGQPARSRGHT